MSLLCYYLDLVCLQVSKHHSVYLSVLICQFICSFAYHNLCISDCDHMLRVLL